MKRQVGQTRPGDALVNGSGRKDRIGGDDDGISAIEGGFDDCPRARTGLREEAELREILGVEGVQERRQIALGMTSSG
jgi:hypothetical protein